MGQQSSTNAVFETAVPSVTATLYYFDGRGRADQIRWLLAATNVDFVQKSVDSREMFLKMAEQQLPFGQLPLLQIDNLELVQSQSIIRYIAKRGKIAGETLVSNHVFGYHSIHIIILSRTDLNYTTIGGRDKM